jgi:hypothetical protein
MAFKFKPKEWFNKPSKATPLSAAAIEDLEARTAGYVDTQKGEPEGIGTLDSTGHQPLSESPLSVVSGSGHFFSAETLEEVEAKVAALLPLGTPYTYSLVSGGVLLDIGGGTT